MFCKQLEFYKGNFETRFFFNNEFYEKISMILLCLFLDACFEIYALHGDFDANKCHMSHCRWRVRKLGLTRFSRDYEVARCCTFSG